MGRVQYPQYLLLARSILLAPLQVRPPAADGNAAAAAAAGAPADVQPAAGVGWLAGGGGGETAGAVSDAAAAPSLPGWCWWALRAALLQQRLLSGRSASLRSLLLGLQRHVLAGFVQPVEAALAQAASSGGDGGGAVGRCGQPCAANSPLPAPAPCALSACFPVQALRCRSPLGRSQRPPVLACRPVQS